MDREALHAWIRRRGLTHRLAAEALGLSVDGLRNNLYGRRPISAQTQRIVELSDELAEQLSLGQKDALNSLPNPR